ncbi:hypothetical protein BJ875DRAFT_455243 [Amylocarpus encephaloides]|uniref:Uncharacterized protein n=1 Tax=Amylocarpus encephaloides TaxID=45428 RepID=A0A9P7YNQ9_9HELO|nr:hypothetical protein BJ875DRAFT_455243 [Amylocarpus encephaloides]
MTKGPSSVLMIGSQTLFPGSAITVDGQEISLAAVGGAVIINPNHATAAPAPYDSQGPPVVVIGSSSLTANSESGFVIGSQTLFPGSAITESGQIITIPPPSPTLTGLASTTLTSVVVTKAPITSIAVAGQTLTAGGRITVGGDILSISPDGTGVIIIGTVTVGGGEATATASADKDSASSSQKPTFGLLACVLFITYLLV